MSIPVSSPNKLEIASANLPDTQQAPNPLLLLAANILSQGQPLNSLANAPLEGFLKQLDALTLNATVVKNQSVNVVSQKDEKKEKPLQQDEKSVARKALKQQESSSQETSELTKVTVRTIRITKRKNSTVLLRLLSLWKEIAKKKEAEAALDNALSEQEKIAGDATSIIEDMETGFPKKIGKTVPYAAVDSANKVQAIALVTFDKERAPTLKYLLTCPENIKLKETDKVFRGAGTAIVAHIVRELQERKNFEDLFLESVGSALGFYKKLGFEVSKREAAFGDTTPMVLPSKKMGAFLKAFGKDSNKVGEFLLT
jgi:hypothetical protein